MFSTEEINISANEYIEIEDSISQNDMLTEDEIIEIIKPQFKEEVLIDEEQSIEAEPSIEGKDAKNALKILENYMEQNSSDANGLLLIDKIRSIVNNISDKHKVEKRIEEYFI